MCREVSAGRRSALLHSSLPARTEHMQSRVLQVELPLQGTRDRQLFQVAACVARNARPLCIRRSRVSDSKLTTFFRAILDPSAGGKKSYLSIKLGLTEPEVCKPGF